VAPVSWEEFPLYALMAYKADLPDSVLKDMGAQEDPYSRADFQDSLLKEFSNKFSPSKPATAPIYNWGAEQIANSLRGVDQGMSVQEVIASVAAAAKAAGEGYGPAAQMINSNLLSLGRHEAEVRQRNADPSRYTHLAMALAAQGKDPRLLMAGLQMMGQQQEEDLRRKVLQNRVAEMRFRFSRNGPMVSGSQVWENVLRANRGDKKYKNWLQNVQKNGAERQKAIQRSVDYVKAHRKDLFS
jgi:hypothetical protein